MEIEAMLDGFSVAMFMNVHEIVHDSLFPSVEAVNPVMALCIRSLNFPVSEIFVNNWAILFFCVFLFSASDVVFHWFCGVGGYGLFSSCS